MAPAAAASRSGERPHCSVSGFAHFLSCVCGGGPWVHHTMGVATAAAYPAERKESQWAG